MRAAGDGTTHTDMRRIRQLRIRIWRHTRALVHTSDAPEFGPLGLDREPTTTRIWHPGTVRARGTTRVAVANEDCLDIILT